MAGGHVIGLTGHKTEPDSVRGMQCDRFSYFLAHCLIFFLLLSRISTDFNACNDFQAHDSPNLI